MSMYKNLMTFGCAAVLALGLAACGGDGGPSQADLDAERDRTEQQMAEVTRLQGLINDALAALGMPADANLSGSIADLQTQLAALQKQIKDAADQAEADRMEAERMAAAATGKALFAALEGPANDGSQNALNNLEVTPPVFTAGGDLTIDRADGAGSLPDNGHDAVNLKRGDSAGSLGGWAGTMYAHSAGTGAAKVTNDAVVYNNKGAGRSTPFADAGYTVIAAGNPNAGSVLLVSAGTTESGIDLADVMVAAFNHQGTLNHPIPNNNIALKLRGTFDGAPGEYSCTGTCTSSNNGSGGPSALGGTWHFKPDTGAMVHQPDTNYLYYGWWVSKDNDGDPTAASAFAGVVGTIAALADDPVSAVTGSATYAGHAAGKFALDYSQNKVLDGASDGGHFTADVELTAKFGTNDAPNNGGVSGTIDNFMANGESVDWSVALHRAPWGTAGAFTSTSDTTNTTADGTTWSIGGTAADESGTWSGQMYDELPGLTTATPPGDGSNVPTTATGTFYSEYSDVGRMVGAFGADRQ